MTLLLNLDDEWEVIFPSLNANLMIVIHKNCGNPDSLWGPPNNTESYILDTMEVKCYNCHTKMPVGHAFVVENYLVQNQLNARNKRNTDRAREL